MKTDRLGLVEQILEEWHENKCNSAIAMHKIAKLLYPEWFDQLKSHTTSQATGKRHDKDTTQK